MKIPESVRIGGVEYAISYVENLRHGNQLAYGHIDYDNCKIELSATDGIGHLHGVQQHAGLEIENEEAGLDMFAKGIYQVLQDNGGRLFDLMETDKKGKSNEKVHASGF